MQEPTSSKSPSEQSYAVSVASLADMLADAGVVLPTGSPLTTLRTSGNGDQRQDERIEWPENWPSQEQALACLTQQPAASISKLLLDHRTDHFVFPWTEPDSHCLYAHAGNSGQLIAPVAPGQVAAFLAEDFNPLGAPAANGIELSFSKEGFLAFAAIADFCRYIYAAGLMERVAVAPHSFTIDQLVEQVHLAAETTDYRWLLSCWPQFYPEDKGVDRDVLQAGCAWLADEGLIVPITDEKADAFAPNVLLLSAISQLINVTVAYFTKNEGEGMTAFIAADALWRINHSGSEVTLVSIDGLELITGLRACLTPAIPSLDAANSTVSGVTLCGHCSVELEPMQKFCSNCGRRNSASSASRKGSD